MKKPKSLKNLTVNVHQRGDHNHSTVSLDELPTADKTSLVLPGELEALRDLVEAQNKLLRVVYF